MHPALIYAKRAFNILAVLAILVSGCAKKAEEHPKLRLGWQPPWSNQGQIVEVLKHTDVLARNKVSVDFKAFTYGGPMGEAARAGEIDILFCGDQPALTLISRDPKWRIVGRMVNYRSGFLVAPNSPIKTLHDLAGKKVATAFGSTTHRDAVRILQEQGFVIDKTLTLVNLDQAEHAAVVARGGEISWGEIDAIATYEPTLAVSVSSRKARLLHEWISPAVVVSNTDLIDKRSTDLKNFLKAYAESYYLYSQDPHQYNVLYSEDSRLPLSDEIYRDVASCEPNMFATQITQIDITLDSIEQNTLQRNANAALAIGIIKKPIKVSEVLVLSLAEQALAEVKVSTR